jgi:hypothetical protein
MGLAMPATVLRGAKTRKGRHLQRLARKPGRALQGRSAGNENITRQLPSVALHPPAGAGGGLVHAQSWSLFARPIGSGNFFQCEAMGRRASKGPANTADEPDWQDLRQAGHERNE